MSITSALAIYFVLWWVVLFVVLPFGVRRPNEDELSPGTDPGAPVIARMGWRLLWTTVLAGVIFAAGVSAYRNGYLDLDTMSRLMGLPL